jgi:hypothetical protein
MCKKGLKIPKGFRSRMLKNDRQHNGHKIPKGYSEATCWRMTDNTRYQRGIQKPYVKEWQTTQWPQDTKGVFRSRMLKNDRQHNSHKIPKGYSEAVCWRMTDNTMATRYTKRVFRCRMLKNDRQNNGHKIPKWYSEAVCWRTTDNTMAQKDKKNINKTLHRKLQIEQYESN